MRYVRERKEERRGEDGREKEERRRGYRNGSCSLPHPESVKAGWVCSAG